MCYVLSYQLVQSALSWYNLLDSLSNLLWVLSELKFPFIRPNMFCLTPPGPTGPIFWSPGAKLWMSCESSRKVLNNFGDVLVCCTFWIFFLNWLFVYFLHFRLFVLFCMFYMFFFLIFFFYTFCTLLWFFSSFSSTF